jgi:Ser/Thr protein kinase RdoA (MazF antagonist)
MAASKRRTRWHDLAPPARAAIERLLGGAVVEATNCSGGFSPGFASRLTRADGMRFFVKAVDASVSEFQSSVYRAEAAVAAALPAAVPAPTLFGTHDDGQWVILAFEHVDGSGPTEPWARAELDRVLAAVAQLALAGNPSPVPLPRDHPRLGGWPEIAGDPLLGARLREHAARAEAQIAHLVELEEQGLAAARGDALVHFDLYPQNIVLAPDRVVFVDWPHARLGAPYVDLVMLLSSAAADGIDPEPLVQTHPVTADVEPEIIDAVLAAYAGFWMAGGLTTLPAEFQPIADYKLRLGLGAIRWLDRRLRRRTGHGTIR